MVTIEWPTVAPHSEFDQFPNSINLNPFARVARHLSWLLAASVESKQSDEAYLSAEQYPPQAQTRLPIAYEDKRRPQRSSPPPRKGSQATRGVHRLEVAMNLRTGRFSRSDRVLHSRDYRRISRCGSRAASKNFVVLAAPMRVVPAKQDRVRSRRLGMTVSRRVGNAIERNRVKRIIREWFRHLRDEFATDTEIVVIARRQSTELDARAVALDLSRLLEHAARASRARSEREASQSA
jgi:ribonuclease P protein component